MATITFPSNPVLNQIYSYDGNTWIWDGSSWQLLTNGALNAVVIGNVVPGPGTFTTVTANTVTANSIDSGTVSANTVTSNTVAAGSLQAATLTLTGNVAGALTVRGPVSGTSFSTVGNIISSDGITSFGNVSAPYFIGDGSLLSNIPSGTNYSNANVASYLPTYSGNLQAGNVSILGNILGNGISILGRVDASGNITGGNILTSGVVSTSGNLIGRFVFGDGRYLSNVPGSNYTNANVAAYLPTYTGNLNASNYAGNGAGLSGLVAANIVGTVANATYATTAGTARSVAAANIVGTVASANTAITAASALTVPASGITGVVDQATQADTANVADQALSVDGSNVVGAVSIAVYANTANVANRAATVTTNAQPNITSVGTLSSLSVSGAITSGNIAGRNITASANITAQYFFGDGSQLTGLPSANYSNANVAAYLPTYTGVVTAESVTATGNIAAANINATTLSATGNITGVNVNAASLTASGNIRGANINATGRISTAGNIAGNYILGNGAFLTGLQSTYGNANVADYLTTYDGFLSAGELSVTGDTTVANLYVYGDEFATQTVLAFGNITGGNLNTAGTVSTTGNVRAAYYFGDGRFLSNVQGTYGNSNVAAYLPTYTGNLNANIITSTRLTSDNIGVSSIITTGGLVATGTVSANSVITGNIAAGGFVSVIGNITGAYLFGDGRYLSNIAGVYSNANVAAYLPTYSGNLSSNNITFTNNITGNNVSVSTVTTSGNVVAGGNLVANSATVITTLSAGNIATVGSVSAVGNVIGNFFLGNGRFLSGLSTYGNSNVALFLATYSGSLTADNLSVSGDVVGNNIYMYGKVFATTIVSAIGNITGGNLTTPGNVSAQGNIRAQYYFGDGRFLSNVQGSFGNANVAAYLPTYTGNLTASVISTTGNITAPYFFGNGSQLTGIQATVVGTLATLSVSGNATIGNISTIGNVQAAYFIGDGSQLTNLPATNYSNANVAAYLPTYTGNVTANIISTTGNVTAPYFFGNGSQLSGMYSNANVASYLPTYSGNLAANTLSVSRSVTAQYFVGDGSQLTGIEATVIGTLANLSVTGNIVTGNLNSLGSVSADGNIVTPENVLAGNVFAAGDSYVDGNIQAGNISVIGQTISTGNITVGTGNFFVGNGRFITGIVSSAVYANTLLGNTLSSNVLYSSLQRVGTLANLAVSGNVSAGNITSGLISASGNIVTSANLIANTVSVGGNVAGTYFIGNGSFLTGIQASNIGTLPSLSVTGNVNIGGYYIGDGGLLSNITVTTTYGNSNVAAYLPTYTGNLAGGNVSVTGNIYGNGAGIRAITGANVVGAVANATYAVFANSAASSNLAAYVSASNQSNITSVGTLTNLSVSGNVRTAGLVSAGGNVVVGSGAFFIGDGGLLSNIQTDYSNANVAAYLPTYTGNLAGGNASVTGNVYSQNISVTGNIYGNIIGNISANIVAPGANTELLFNGGGEVAASAALTFNDSTKVLYANGIISATGNITSAGNITGNYILGNGAFLTGLPASYSNANVAAYLPTYTGNLTAGIISSTGNITATGNIAGSYLLGNASQLTSVPSVLTVSNWNTGNVISNTIANVKALRFNANTGITVTDLGNAEALVSLGSSFATWEVAGQANLVAHGEDVVKFVAGPGIVITTNAGATPQEIAFAANVSNISNGTSNISIVNNSNIRAVVSGANVVTIDSTGLTAVGNIAGSYVIGNGAFLTGLPAGYSNANVAAYLPTYSGNLTAAVVSASGNVTAAYFIGDGSQLTNLPSTTPVGNAINLGSNSQGQLVSNAVTLTANTSVTNGIALLNQVLGKLVPASPPNFPNSTSLAVASLSTYRMANFTQTDNTPELNKNVSGGSTVTTARRAASYSTNTIANVGPGDSGTVIAVLNGVNSGNVTLTSSLNGNGTYSNLVITNNYDYHVANSSITAGFWGVFTAQASGAVPAGWNEVYIADTATGNTNTPYWYYDASTPGTPGVGNLTISASTVSNTYSSTVAHYNTSTQFTLGFTANRLSGDMYPTSDTFVTGTAGGAFNTPTSVTYTTAGVTTPLARNLYVSSGSQSVSTTANITSGFGASTTGPSVSVLNSYATGTGTFTTALNANVLYKTGTASTMEEANIVVGGTIGSGSGLAFRIVNPGSSDTPAYTGSEAAFNSQTGPLQTYDATIVAAVLKHDQTNYSTGYLPVGPNLSSGRSGSQYFTFKIQRSSVSKFDVKWTGTIAGLWVALPGSSIDSTSSLNGWLDMSVSYGGAGAPGANTGAGGNGSNGCALGGVAPLNSAQTNKSVTATFGTVSSTSATNNEIYIRIKLTSGQSVTALSLQPASN